jgi:hypothetical protein
MERNMNSNIKHRLSDVIRQRLHEEAYKSHVRKMNEQYENMLFERDDDRDPAFNVPPPSAPGGIAPYVPPPGVVPPGFEKPYRPRWPKPHFNPNTPPVVMPPPPPNGYPGMPISPEQQYQPAIPWYSPYNPFYPGFHTPGQWYNPFSWHWQWNSGG